MNGIIRSYTNCSHAGKIPQLVLPDFLLVATIFSRGAIRCESDDVKNRTQDVWR